MGVPVASLGAESLAGLYRELDLLGRLTGHEDDAARLTNVMKRRVERVVETARTLKPEQRVTVFYHVWSEPLTAAGAGSYIGELIQMCGGINIVSDAKERYPHISQEVLFARNPEVILAPTTEAEPVTVEWLRTRPGWNNLRAVRNNRIYLIDGDLISRCGPRLVDALEVMARAALPRSFRHRHRSSAWSSRYWRGAATVKAPAITLGLLAAILVASAVLSLGVGAVSIPAGRVMQILVEPPVSGAGAIDVTIVWELRLPRLLLAGLIGGGLGAAGAGYQGLFRNPLADPFVIGASSGSALGATLAIVAGLRESVFGMGAVSAAALLGSLLAVAAAYGIASMGRQVSIPSLLLAGVAVSNFIIALVSLLMFLNDEKLLTIFSWLMGSLSGRGWPVLWTTAPLVLAGGLTVWLQSRSLDSLTFGEETAVSLGLRLGRFRVLVVVAASLATAAGVAAGGIIGFVGLVSPHVARLLVGARHVLLIPASGLLGALLLLLADDLARTIAAPAELPVGVVTALLGSPFFLVLLKTHRRELGAMI